MKSDEMERSLQEMLKKPSESSEEYLPASVLNWAASSRTSSVPELDFQNGNPLLDTAPHLDCVSDRMDSQWVDVPLSDDEDEQPRPRGGARQFQQSSKTESAIERGAEAMTDRSDGWTLSANRSTLATPSPDRSSPIGLFAGNSSRNFDLSFTLAKQKASAASDCGDFCYDRYRSTAFANQDFEPIGTESAESPNSEESMGSKNAGTQTLNENNGLVNTKVALQNRLADATNALNLTRNQADKLRDSLRTCTAGMKQQTGDLRTLSRNLSNALDQAREYKLQWKNESNMKEEAKKKVDELNRNVTCLEKTLGQRDSEMQIFHQGVNTLNVLLGVDAHETSNAADKFVCITKKVKKLLDLVKRLESDVTMNSAINLVELNKSLKKFEDEKTSWASFIKTNEKDFSDRYNRLERDNDVLRAELKKAQRSFSELQSLLSQSKSVREENDAKLKQSRQTINDFQAALCEMESRLQKSLGDVEREVEEKAKLQATFMQQNLKLEDEKRMIENSFNKLKKEVELKKTSVRDQATSCNIIVDEQKVEDTHHVPSSDTVAHPPLFFNQSSSGGSISTLRENRAANKNLQQEIIDLQHSIADMRKDLANTEEECVRLRGDVRQLRQTCHHREITIQTVRTENRDLRISISNLKLSRKSSDNQRSSETPQPPKCRRFHSGGRSESESDRLHTIPESCDENNSNVTSPPTDRTSISSPKSFNLPSPTSSISTDPERNTKQTSSVNSSANASGVVSNTSLSRESNRSRSSFEAIGGQPSLKRCKSHSTPKSKHHVTVQKKESSNRCRNSNGSTISEDFFHSSSALATPRSFIGNRSSKRRYDTRFQNGRLLAIPMSEEEFTRLTGSINYDHEPTCYENASPIAAGNSWYDDGYSSFTPDATEYHTSDAELYSTVIFHRADSPTVDTTGSESTRSLPEGPCPISYRGVTFDASKFGIAEMRQFTWDSGIDHSADEMRDFIDFLAAKADELDSDPIWKNAHSLGKSKDWLSLKDLF